MIENKFSSVNFLAKCYQQGLCHGLTHSKLRISRRHASHLALLCAGAPALHNAPSIFHPKHPFGVSELRIHLTSHRVSCDN